MAMVIYLRHVLLTFVVILIATSEAARRLSTSSGSLVNFDDPKIQGHLDALVRMAQSCVIKVRATPKDVKAYFTNSSPMKRTGQCFAACMLEQSDVINHGKVDRELLVHLASLINGKQSRVVRKLNSVSRICLDTIEGLTDRCQLASTYNDCLNENMMEFAFPLDIAEEAVKKMPFHLIQPNHRGLTVTTMAPKLSTRRHKNVYNHQPKLQQIVVRRSHETNVAVQLRNRWRIDSSELFANDRIQETLMLPHY